MDICWVEKNTIKSHKLITERDLIKKTATKFGLPEAQVADYYKAFVRGLKTAVKESDILKFSIFKDLELTYTTEISYAEHGLNKPSKEYVRSRVRRNKRVKKHMKSLRTRNTVKVIERKIDFRRKPPLEYYGYLQGYTLKELEDIQNRMFEKVNKYDYETVKKSKEHTTIKDELLSRRPGGDLGTREEEDVRQVPFEF